MSQPGQEYPKSAALQQVWGFRLLPIDREEATMLFDGETIGHARNVVRNRALTLFPKALLKLGREKARFVAEGLE